MKSDVNELNHDKVQTNIILLHHEIRRFSNTFKRFYSEGQRACSFVHESLSSLHSLQISYNEVVRERKALLEQFENKKRMLVKIKDIMGSYMSLKDPVVASDSWTYQRNELERYMVNCRSSNKPALSGVTGEVFTGEVIPNLTLLEVSTELNKLLNSLDNEEHFLPQRMIIESFAGDLSKLFPVKNESEKFPKKHFFAPNTFESFLSSKKTPIKPSEVDAGIPNEKRVLFNGGQSNEIDLSSVSDGEATMIIGDVSCSGAGNLSSGLLVDNDEDQGQVNRFSSEDLDELQERKVLERFSTEENDHDTIYVNNTSRFENLTTSAALLDSDNEGGGGNIFSSSPSDGANELLYSPEAIFTPSLPTLHPCIRVFGSCKFNDDCRFAKYPYAACLNDLKGKCRYGVLCKELHVNKDDLLYMNPLANKRG